MSGSIRKRYGGIKSKARRIVKDIRFLFTSDNEFDNLDCADSLQYGFDNNNKRNVRHMAKCLKNSNVDGSLTQKGVCGTEFGLFIRVRVNVIHFGKSPNNIGHYFNSGSKVNISVVNYLIEH
jgi:hypothetical protein